MIELIVIMAIMTVAVGASVLSVSLVTGSEAKKACQKLDAMLNEVKTGAMSRLDEDVTVVYKTKDTTVTDTGSGLAGSGDIDKDGFYAVKEITTLTTLSGTGSGVNINGYNVVKGAMIDNRSVGTENRILCDNRVLFTLYYQDASGADASTDLSPDGTTSFTIKYDRATGNFKNCLVNGVEQGLPQKLVMTAGFNKRNFFE